MSNPCGSGARARFVRREYDRSAVALAAIVTLGDQEYSARILNLSLGGAMIECSTTLPAETSFLLRCGSIAADCGIVWQKSGQYGVNFRLPLREEQVTEQLSRDAAKSSRELLEDQLNSPRGRSSTVDPGDETRNTTDSSASAAYLSDIASFHQRVETGVLCLERFMAGELSDLGAFSEARLRLRQANVGRTQVALDACRHLMTTHSAYPDLRDLQRRELDVSQMISSHVQQWTTQRLQDDWAGYCEATRRVLIGVRALVAAEKELLCPLLRADACEHRKQ